MSELDLVVAKFKATKALVSYNEAADRAASLRRSRYSTLEEYLDAEKAEKAAKDKLAAFEAVEHYIRRRVCA